MDASDPGTVTAAELGDYIGMATRSVVELAKRGIAVKAAPNRYRLKRVDRPLLRRSSAAGEGKGRRGCGS